MKIIFQQIPVTSLYNHIANGFSGDSDLFEKYCYKTGNFDEVVRYVYDRILDTAQTNTVVAFIVKLKDKNRTTDIGYTTVIFDKVNMLHSFGINPIFRKKNNLMIWLEGILMLLGCGYYIALYEKNTRAIDFFIKNGFVRDERVTTFINKIEDKTIALCQQEVQ